jgi:hypothetical protein
VLPCVWERRCQMGRFSFLNIWTRGQWCTVNSRVKFDVLRNLRAQEVNPGLRREKALTHMKPNSTVLSLGLNLVPFITLCLVTDRCYATGSLFRSCIVNGGLIIEMHRRESSRWTGGNCSGLYDWPESQGHQAMPKTRPFAAVEECSFYTVCARNLCILRWVTLSSLRVQPGMFNDTLMWVI